MNIRKIHDFSNFQDFYLIPSNANVLITGVPAANLNEYPCLTSTLANYY